MTYGPVDGQHVLMDQTALPVAGDWCTMGYAAEKIGVSLREVGRLIKDGRLDGQRPRVSSQESGRHKTILSTAQVHEYAWAFKMTRQGRGTNDQSQ